MTDLVYESNDAIPEGLREFAAEKDGKYVVAVAPKVKADEWKTKLDEFRTTNIAVKQERDALKSERDGLVERVNKYGSIIGENFDAFTADLSVLRETKKQVDDGKLVASTTLEEALNQRTNDMRKDYDGKLTAAQKEVEKWQSEAVTLANKYKTSTVERAIRDAIIDPSVGARVDATTDILERAMKVFRVDDDDKLVAIGQDGKKMYGNDAGDLTPKEWLGKLREQAPYFFMESKGGGAAGGKQPEPVAIDDDNMTMDQFLKLRAEGKLR